jgi:hypothetical protein
MFLIFLSTKSLEFFRSSSFVLVLVGYVLVEVGLIGILRLIIAFNLDFAINALCSTLLILVLVEIGLLVDVVIGS